MSVGCLDGVAADGKRQETRLGAASARGGGGSGAARRGDGGSDVLAQLSTPMRGLAIRRGVAAATPGADVTPGAAIVTPGAAIVTTPES